MTTSEKEILKAWNSPAGGVSEVKPEDGCPKCGRILDLKTAYEHGQPIYAHVCDPCRFIGYDPRPNVQAAILEWMTRQ